MTELDAALDALAGAIVSLEPAKRFRKWSVDAFTDGHAPQRNFIVSRAPRKHLIAARQSGKSTGDDGLLIDRGLLYPDSMHILLGLNGVAVRANNWIPIWQRQLNEFRVQRRDNATLMQTTFANNARVYFSGTDDLRHVRNILGNRLHNGTFIIDEAQDQPPEVLDYLLDVVLPPMTTPTTQIVLSGVRPDIPVGRFYDLRNDDAWEHHTFSRWANVHTPEARAQLAEYLTSVKLTMEDLDLDLEEVAKRLEPGKLAILMRVARDWLNRDVYDPNARDYHYRVEVNQYKAVTPAWALGFQVPQGFGEVRFAEPWPGIDTFSVGIDPGGGDPFGLQVVGWGKNNPRIQHLVDWTSPRDARLTWGVVMRVLGSVVQAHYSTKLWRYDSNSDTELDTFGHEFGVPVVQAAKKSDFEGSVRRSNDLLETGRLAVMEGSSLERDYQSAKLDPKTRRWSAAYHPTASECVRYALREYWERLPKVAPPKPTMLDPFDREALQSERNMKTDTRIKQSRAKRINGQRGR